MVCISTYKQTHHGMENLDNIDLKLLDLLQNNAKLTVKELSAAVNLSLSPTYDRVKRLEREGYILKYMAVLNAQKLEQGFVVYCNVKLRHINSAIAKDFASNITELREVAECYNISGEYDYLLKIRVADMRQYQRFLIDKIGQMDCVSAMQSVFVMDEIKREELVPLPETK